MFKKHIKSLVLLLLILCVVLAGCGKKEPLDEKVELAQTFAVAVLSGDQQTIRECAHQDMQEILVLSYGQNEFVFKNCKATAEEEMVMYRDGIENYISTLNRDYSVRINLEEAIYYNVAFTAEYNGKEYAGTMSVLVGTEAGEHFVLEAELVELETAFYEDNFPEGDYYYDLHGEE